MNIISTMIGLSIAGAAAPMLMDMSLAPVIAQKRAQNFGSAEAAAVIYAAKNEGVTNPSNPSGGCVLDRSNAPAYTILCTEGTGKFFQNASRSFIGEITNNSGSNSTPFQYPVNHHGLNGHVCHAYENWGTSGINSTWDPDEKKWTGPSCVPDILFTEGKFDDSKIEDWLWDINKLYDRGNHPNYSAFMLSYAQ